MLKQLCIVLRAANYRDSDKMLTLFSRSEGKISAQASRVRNIKSALTPATQPFCCAEFEFYQKKERLYLTNAHIREEFFAIQNDYDTFTAGCVMLELTEKILEHATETNRLFVTLTHSLYAMEKHRVKADIALAYFFVQCLHMLGIFPATEFCVICGEDIESLRFWNATEGGGVCDRCAATVHVRKLPPSTDRLLLTMLHTAPAKLVQFNIDNFSVMDFIQLLNNYLLHAGDIQLKTMQYFKPRP